MPELHLPARQHEGLPPPICRTPTSKLTRVRVDGLSKIMAMVLPASGPLPALRTSSPARAPEFRSEAVSFRDM